MVSVQGKGSYVAPQNEEMLKEEHLRQIEEHLRTALDIASISGVSLKEIIDILYVLEGEN